MKKPKQVKKKIEYLVLVPFSSRGDKYAYTSMGGIFTSIRAAKRYMKNEWVGELLAIVGPELSNEQRKVITEKPE